ncbi:hypothetical protein AFLA_011458 [Aspergillus flavus NRRL3357]|nr:hypothetical protein AFLA_011458 [Aspergillus flavus NRRL3357]
MNYKTDGPPPLPLDLHEYKLQIFLNWGFILLTSCIVPLVLYPSLHWGANLSIKISLSVASAILGATTLFSLGMRTWRLFKPTSNCRPLKSESQWNLGVRQPFKVSSLPAGEVFRPGILVIIEDVVAVDGARDKAYRAALLTRYAASVRFQRLIEALNWFWGLGGCLMGVLLIAVISTVRDQTFAFGLGWVIPWIWAGVWAVITTYWVKSALREEKRSWPEGRWTNAV